MYRKFIFDDFKIMSVMTGIFFLTFVFGCVFCGFSDSEKCMRMSEYLTSFFANAKDLNCYNVAIGALKENAIMFGLIFLSAFFKAGIILDGFVLARRGFVIGFTLSSFLKIFGNYGLLAVLAMVPELLIFLPVLLKFSSTSTKISIFNKESKKNILFFFIIFSILIATIFCGSAFWNGYITTIFMKRASVKILQ